MHQLLVCSVNKLDGLTARYEELDSRTNIMQNSLFTVLNKKIDDKLSGLADTMKKCTESQAKLDENLLIATQNNTDTRRFLEDHLRGSHLNRPQAVNNLPSSDDITSNTSLDADISPVDIKLKELSDAINDLKDENHKMDIRLIQTEQYSRRESLVFSGIPADIPQDQLENTVMNILHHLGFEDLIEDDI